MLSRRPIGLTLLALGVLLPVVTYIGGHFYNTNLASYGGPPDQGAMVLTYLAVLGSFALGACVALVGLVIALVPTRKQMPHA